MSYCVHCGVELACGEKHCPLCQTPVINPNAPWKDTADRPYPRHLETVTRHIDRRYFATLTSTLLLIPLLITLFCDWIANDGITWSPYVAGALALLFVYGVLPFFFKRPNAVLCIAADCAATLLYLLLIEYGHGGHWFLPIGMPIALSASVLVLALAILFTRKKRMGFLLRVGCILMAIGLFVMAIDIIISLFAANTPLPSWSLYAMIPCVLLGIAAMVINTYNKLKEEVRRRLFF